MLTIKRNTIEEMGYEELIDFMRENDFDEDLVTEEEMKEYIVEAVYDDYWNLVRHLSEYMNGAEYYIYDRGMGTCEDPTPLENEFDIINYLEDNCFIEIEEDEEEDEEY